MLESVVANIPFACLHAFLGVSVRLGVGVVKKSYELPENAFAGICYSGGVNSLWELFQTTRVYEEGVRLLTNRAPGNSDFWEDFVLDNASAIAGYFAADFLIRKFKGE